MTPEDIPSWAPFLSRIPLFSGLSAEDLTRLAVRMQPLSLPKSATLYSPGDEADAFYIITSGQVRVIHNVAGRETVAAFLGRGDALGEVGLLTGETRGSAVRLDTTCEFLRLARKDFEEVLRETPSILMHLSRMLAKRLVSPAAATPMRSPADAGQMISLNAALNDADRLLLTVSLARHLMEQSRRRVLLVDMGPDAGQAARSLGLPPALIDEQALRAVNLRDPATLETIAQEHPSGLRVLTLPAAALGGRLYGSIYLFLNYLRDGSDFVVASLGSALGDVERTIISEADTALLAGTDGQRPQFRQLEAQLQALTNDPKKILRVWLGDPDPEDGGLAPGVERMALSWPGTPAETLEGKPAQAVARLARRLCGLEVGLALGTGAALGYSLIGVLKVFKREGIPIDIISGTSIGSLMAGFFALGIEPEELEDIALRIDKSWVYQNLFLDLTLPRSGLFAGQTLLRFLRSYFGSREFSDLEIPFACVATDIETGDEVVLKDGRVADAVRASCGLPMIFAPTFLNGRYLVDGGLVNPVPTRVLSDMGADILIAVNLTMPARSGAPRPRATRENILELVPAALKAPNLLEVFFQMIYTMEYQIAQSRVDLAHVAMHPDLGGFSWTELHRAKEIVAIGERVAMEHVPRIKALLPFFSGYHGRAMKRIGW